MVDVQHAQGGSAGGGVLSLWVPDGPSVPPAAVEEVPVSASVAPVAIEPAGGHVGVRRVGARYAEDLQAFPRVNLVLDVELACSDLVPGATIRLAYHVTAVVLPLA